MSDYQICSVIEELKPLGIDAGRFEKSFVENTLRKRMAETRCGTREEYIRYLKENEHEAGAYDLLLQNSHSEFFRNPLTFSVLEKIVLPSLAAEKRLRGKELRIWSAACASGQEPYSLAMLLEECESGSNVPVRYRIFATDKSNNQIEHARNGLYSSFSLGQVPVKRISKWFDEKTSGSRNTLYAIKSTLKRNIDFSVFDLLDKNLHVPSSSIFGNFDLVFCANLLFYYKTAYREIIIDKISKSLVKNGLLVAGESERNILKQKGFTELYYQSAIFRV